MHRRAHYRVWRGDFKWQLWPRKKVARRRGKPKSIALPHNADVVCHVHAKGVDMAYAQARMVIDTLVAGLCETAAFEFGEHVLHNEADFRRIHLLTS